MAAMQRGGKTAPRLVEDLKLYDQAHSPPTDRNLLSEVPPVYPEGWDGPSIYLSPHGCRHNYVTKTDQTFVAGAEGPPRTGTSSRVSAVCSECRTHIQVIVIHTDRSGNKEQSHDHMHHLLYKSGRQKNGLYGEEVTQHGQVAETYNFQCSYQSCSAVVSLRIVSPLLKPEHVQILTNSQLIRTRAEDAIAASPERLEGMSIPEPFTILDNLRTYISNALRSEERGKSIRPNNKRFMIAFGIDGEPCKEVLEFLGFSIRESDGAWVPPQVDPKATKPYHDEACVFLDDALHELLCLIHSRPASEKRGTQPQSLPPSASAKILHALGASSYPKAARFEEFLTTPAPFYEDLGAVEDMSSGLIAEAYDRQVATDPINTSYYLRCLKGIGLLRGGEDLHIIDQTVQVAYAEGKYTEDDVIEAYRYFGLWHEDPNLSEDIIIGKFYAFLASTNQETETRIQLWRIGDAIGSDRVKAASEDRVSTVQQAYVFLGVNDQTPDDFIITMYTAKVNDSPSCKGLADQAVQLIAESRSSSGLNHFINTGETFAGEMDVGDAYRLLQIPDRTADEQSIIAAYTICIDEISGDNVDQMTLYNSALCIIAKELNNPTLKSFAGLSDRHDYRLSEWPTGLRNIGNTCYLNSLLQFYFSIRPYREMVLASESHRMHLNDESSLTNKQVGSRQVTKEEIERSLKFLGELGVLFRDMIMSSQSCVNPGPELARLTLISPSNEAAIHRRSTVSHEIPRGLGEIDGFPVLGPQGPPPSATGDLGTRADTVEAKGGTEADEVGDHHMSGVPDNDDTTAPAQLTGLSPDDEGYVTLTPPKSEFPNNPPPVPPRPTPEADRQKQLLEEVEIGAQQDVTEVINNVLFQSQCAIKPRRVDDDGEQVDQIKDLFYGRSQSYISTESGIRSKEERWCDIKVNVASGPSDIYAALDGAFDKQKISVEGSEADQYSSISRIPPILQIQVQRVQFDSVKKSSFKSTNHLQLLETIYMDRYMDTSKAEIMDQRRLGWEWKENLRYLEGRRAELLRTEDNDGWGTSSLFDDTNQILKEYGLPTGENRRIDGVDHAQQHMGDACVSDGKAIVPRLTHELEWTSFRVESELKMIDEEITTVKSMISSQFSDLTALAYRLYAVFVHRGTVSFGHYWIYIYDIHENIWRKYNDEYVTEVQDVREIFQHSTDSNPPTPYFLVYINDALKERLVDPVCRDVAPAVDLAGMEGVEPTSPAPTQGH